MTSVRKWTGREARALREAMRVSQRDFADQLGVSGKAISNWESGGVKFIPRHDSQAILDTKFRQVSDEVRARFHLILGVPAEDNAKVSTEIQAVNADIRDDVDGKLVKARDLESSSETAAWEVSELMESLEHSEVGAKQIEILAETVNRLCSAYGKESAYSLHPVIRSWITRIGQLMERRNTLAQHRELLVCAGWLFLLGGCVEYDMGWKGAAETSRVAALQIGRETGHGEIQAWSWEMAAWFALTQGRTGDIAAYVDAGQRIGGKNSVIVQLEAHLARAAARMGDSLLVERVLDSGYTKLSRMPKPHNPKNHFVIDPDKWAFYAMDSYRLLGDDIHATANAQEVLRLGQGANGEELMPMRMAEARLTLSVSAARSGELEEAVTVAESAFVADRKSLPSLLMVASELENELVTRYPSEAPTIDYRDKLTELKRNYALQLKA